MCQQKAIIRRYVIFKVSMVKWHFVIYFLLRTRASADCTSQVVAASMFDIVTYWNWETDVFLDVSIIFIINIQQEAAKNRYHQDLMASNECLQPLKSLIMDR